jgi:hypothetical protein
MAGHPLIALSLGMNFVLYLILNSVEANPLSSPDIINTKDNTKDIMDVGRN